MNVGLPVFRGRHFTVLVQSISLFSLAAACSQDPAFVNKTKDTSPLVAGNRGVSADANVGGRGSPETDAGQEAARRGGSDPITGEILASAPPPQGGENGSGSGAGGSDGAGGDGGAGSGGAGSAENSAGGVRGTPENPIGNEAGGMPSGGTPTAVPTAQPTAGPTAVPTVQPTATPVPSGTPRAGSPVVFNTMQKQGKVDILWVVDDSGSMTWAQGQLSSKFESFARKLSDARVDFRVAVTTADVCDIDWSSGAAKADARCPNKDDISAGEIQNGVMVGPPQGRFLVDSTTGKSVLVPAADFVSSFARLAKPGVSGSGLEHGLTAAKMAVEKSLAGVNKNFLRSDAVLSIIVLSDEEDDGVQIWCEDAWGRTTTDAQGAKDLTKCRKGGTSPFLDVFGMAPYAVTLNPATNQPWTQYKFTADNLKSYLDSTSVKGPGKFRVSAITGVRGSDGRMDCSNPDVPANSGPKESGTNYIKAAQLTGGAVENICASEWSQLLSNIGQNTSELANQIALPAGKVPFGNSLEVFVDGVKWDASKFTYKSDGNFVVFKVIPASGAAIKVKYLETVN